MSPMRSLVPFAWLLVAALGCSNGNPKTYEVRGVVRFPDGQTLAEGTIEFEALDREMPIMATSEIGEDGTFEMGTFAMDDGAVEGRHRAVIVSNHEIGTGAERPGRLEQSKLHLRFADFNTSKLEFDVKPGKNEFNITVEYAPRGRQ
ncbi:MAG: hypothetical protein O3C40_37900 [Planctomycetota bacterium]|nr:hypothetical protein [Planctomycetota bacterium]